MAELKTQRTKASVAEFLAKVPESSRADAQALLKLMRKATGMKPAMWGTSIVGFGSFHYKSERSSQEGDWMLTGFSPRKANLTIYIMCGVGRQQELLKKLGKFKLSGGSCVYIRKLSDVHAPTLVKLVQEGVKAMRKRYPDARSS
jgi:hypothetical protein